MSRNDAHPVPRAPQPRKNQSGQSLVLVALMLTFVLGCMAFAIDLGYAYACYQRLQASADAAAIAAASALPNGTLATQYADQYSATAGNLNVIAGLTVTMSPPSFACSQALVTEFGLTCPTASGQIVRANAAQVVEHASVPTFFAKIFGLSTIPIAATASARARGSAEQAVNVVIVAQATGHTGGVQDSNCPIYDPSGTWGGRTPYQADCIKSGIRILLSQLWPCAAGQMCTGSNPYDEVSLMLFPGLNKTTKTGAASQAAEFTPCGYNNNLAGITPYIQESYASSANPLFTVVPFSSGYRTSTTSALNGGASGLVQAVDWADGVTGCTSANYGYANIWETDYAPVITAAQTALLAESASRPNTQNLIILVSDGDAPGQGGCSGSNNYCNGGGQNQCQQGVTAAKNAAAAGITVYSVAYGANTQAWNGSSGTCSLDWGCMVGVYSDAGDGHLSCHLS